PELRHFGQYLLGPPVDGVAGRLAPPPPGRGDRPALFGVGEVVLHLLRELLGIGEGGALAAFLEVGGELVGPLVEEETAAGGNVEGPRGDLVAARFPPPGLAEDR